MEGESNSNEQKVPRSGLVYNFKKWLSNLLQSRIRTHQQFLDAAYQAKHYGVIDVFAFSIVESCLKVEKLRIRDIMIPKTNMITLKTDQKDFLQVVVKYAHSRFPVINDNGEVEGILLAKDILNFFIQDEHSNDSEKQVFEYKDYLRDCITIVESERLLEVLKKFQNKRSHMAVVIDEYKKISGLITLEDILEEFVGDIEDEHDAYEDNIIADNTKNKYLVKGKTNIDNFQKYFNTTLENSDDVDTISGYIVKTLGQLPKKAQTIIVADKFEFKLLKTDGKKLDLLELRIIKAEQEKK